MNIVFGQFVPIGMFAAEYASAYEESENRWMTDSWALIGLYLPAICKVLDKNKMFIYKFCDKSSMFDKGQEFFESIFLPISLLPPFPPSALQK